MTDFRIRFDGDTIILPGGYNIGVQGEHNAVQLVITLPDSMVQDMSYHVVTLGGVQSAIITDAAENVDGAYRSGNTIYMPMTAAYTKSCNVDLTVTAYRQIGSVPTVVDKTPTVYGLRFSASAGDAVDIPGGLVAQVADITKTQHTHPNKPTLDRLTEIDGVLYLDGKRLDGVIVWPIQKDPVIPAQQDGTLLYTVYGEDGLMSSDPYLVEIQGVLYRKPAPWKPGQLWVCRGGIWYLLTAEGKTVFDPSEVAQGRDDGFGGIDEEEVFAPAPLPDEGGGADTDDVVLLPMGEPLHLIARADFGSAPMYAMESFIRQNDPKFDFYVDGADGTRIRMIYNGVSVFDVEVNGNSSADLPESFTIASINGYASVEALPADMLEAYRTFCSFVNTSAEAMGSGTPISGKAEIPTVGLLWNRTYAIRLDDVDNDSIEIFFAENADDDMIAQEAYTTLYAYFPQDIDAAISGVDYFVGGVPQTTQGWHKWIFNRMPNGQVSLGALDMEAIT